MIANLRSKLIHVKVYVNRALTYASLVNMGLILFLAMSNLEKYGIDIMLGKWLIPIILLIFLLLILVGYLEDKLGFFQEEQKVHAVRNPPITEILERLKKIESKLG
ncbi:MAG: hypothetical protein KAK00_10285 [Nanoarchaeota archaeon]|nr:hypothetical protein [Nanoarchaeota archaeon]